MVATDAPGDQPNAALVETLRQIVGADTLALDAAKAAAPHAHPRAGSAGEGGGAKDVVPLAERLAYYARRDAIEDNRGKVVELKGQLRT